MAEAPRAGDVPVAAIFVVVVVAAAARHCPVEPFSEHWSVSTRSPKEAIVIRTHGCDGNDDAFEDCCSNSDQLTARSACDASLSGSKGVLGVASSSYTTADAIGSAVVVALRVIGARGAVARAQEVRATGSRDGSCGRSASGGVVGDVYLVGRSSGVYTKLSALETSVHIDGYPFRKTRPIPLLLTRAGHSDLCALGARLDVESRDGRAQRTDGEDEGC